MRICITDSEVTITNQQSVCVVKHFKIKIFIALICSYIIHPCSQCRRQRGALKALVRNKCKGNNERHFVGIWRVQNLFFSI